MDAVKNRMETAVKNRDVKPDVKIEDEPLPQPAQMVKLDANHLGIICPSCGRGMQPRTVRTRPPYVREAKCSLCNKDIVITYEITGIPAYTRVK